MLIWTMQSAPYITTRFGWARYCNGRLQTKCILALFGMSMLQPVIELI